MSTAPALPTPGSHIIDGRTVKQVISHGCATGWDDCPHGPHGPDAITVARTGSDGKPAPRWALTECVNGRTALPVPAPE